MLINRLELKDIREYEISNKCSLLDMLSELSVLTIIEFIKLGNIGVDTDEQAGDILDEYFQTHSLIDAYDEIRDYLVGKYYVQKENSESTETENYKSLTDLYTKIGIELRTHAKLGYSEFWNMSVDDMYIEFNVLNEKYLSDKQDKLNDMHLQALWNAAAMIGKLDSKPPQLLNKEEYRDDEESDMDADTLRNLINMKKFIARANREEEQNG